MFRRLSMVLKCELRAEEMIDRAGRDAARPQVRAGGLKPGSTSSARVPRPTSLRQGLPAQRAPQANLVHLRALSNVDLAIVTAGVFTAVASASFATYMVSTNHPHPVFNGIEHLMLFARPNHGLPLPVIARVPQTSDDQGIDFTATGTIPGSPGLPATPAYTLPAVNDSDGPHPGSKESEHRMLSAQPNRGSPLPVIARAPQTSDDQGIDFTATGTIPGSAGPLATPAYAPPALRERDGPIIKGFTLRGVSGNVAMVEGADAIYRIEPGATLPGAGRVLAIQWRKGKFVVVTTLGIIAEEQS